MAFLKRLQENSKRESLVRRKDQEIADKDVLESLLEKAMVCRIGLSDNNVPYIVPVCFGYADECIYIHSSSRGKKIDIIQRNDQVCFEIDVDVELVRGDTPCNCTVTYNSVIGFGKASLVEDYEEKKRALDIISAHYLGEDDRDYPEPLVNVTSIIRIEVETMTGKRSKIS
jgi:uncharacterized protein